MRLISVGGVWFSRIRRAAISSGRPSYYPSRMLDARRFLRWLFVCAAAVQVLLPASAAVADGLLQRDEPNAASVAAHVEDFGSTTCKRIHTDDCALCRVMTAPVAPSRPFALPHRVSRLAATPTAERSRLAHAAPHALPASRAPPALDQVAA